MGTQCSAGVSITTYTVPPSPTGVVAASLGTTSVTLGWTDGAASSPLQLYEAKCAAAGANCSAPAAGAGQLRVSRGTQTAEVTGLASRQNYTCFIVASNIAGSACSAGTLVTTYSVPDAPGGLNATSLSTTRVNVTWQDNGLAIPAQQYDLKCVLPGAGCSGVAEGTTSDPASSFGVALGAPKTAPSLAGAKAPAPSRAVAKAPAPSRAVAKAATPTLLGSMVTKSGAVARGVRTSAVVDLTPGRTYDCYVRASNVAGTTCSAPLTVRTYIAPSAVAGPSLNATAVTTTSATASWGDGFDAVPSQSYTLVAVLAGAGCAGAPQGAPSAATARGVASASVTNLRPDAAYDLHVKASNAAGVSCSPALPVRTQLLPVAPGALSSFLLTANYVTLAWDDNSTQPAGQRFDVRCTMPGTGCNGTVVGTGDANITAGAQLGQVVALAGATNYTCYARGLNGGSVACSQPLTITTRPAPPAAVNVSVANITTSDARFAWSLGSPADPVERYRVKCVASGDDCEGRALGTGQVNIARSARAGAVAGLPPNANVTCFIRSTNVFGVSCSVPVAVATYGVPQQPASLNVTSVRDDRVSLTWADGPPAVPAQTYTISCRARGAGFESAPVGSVVRRPRGVGAATVANLTAASPLDCFVAATNAAGTNVSLAVPATTITRPQKPLNVSAAATGVGSVALAWADDNSAGVQPTPTFGVLCVPLNASCDATQLGVGQANIWAGARAGFVSGLAPGATVSCFAVASTPAGAACSDPVVVTTYAPPVAPYTLAATLVQDTSVIVSWLDGQPASSPAERYRVKCVLPGAGCNGTAQGTVQARIPRGTQIGYVTGLVPSTWYECYVRASSAAGASCSRVVPITTASNGTASAAPDAPTILSALSFGSRAVIAWVDSNATTNAAFPARDVKCVASGAGCGGEPAGTPISSGVGSGQVVVNALPVNATVDCFVVAYGTGGPACSAPASVVVGSSPVAPGTYFDGLTFQTCPANSYCRGGGVTGCPAGTISLSGSGAVDECAASPQRDDVVGTGPAVTPNSKVGIYYKLWLFDVNATNNQGALIDSRLAGSNNPFFFIVGNGNVITGWDRGILGMKVGGVRTKAIPPEDAYGDRAVGNIIPPSSTLLWEVQLASLEQSAAPGTYYDGTAVVPCPANAYCAGGLPGAATPCPVNTASPAGSTAAADCVSAWYVFTNTYVSDGEFIARQDGFTEQGCRDWCKSEPGCAAAYWGSLAVYGGQCSLVPAGNVGLLYQRYGSMTPFNPNDRVASIYISRVGGLANLPQVGGGFFLGCPAGTISLSGSGAVDECAASPQRDDVVGTGPAVVLNSKVGIYYKLWLFDVNATNNQGALIDSRLAGSNNPFYFIVGNGNVITGLDRGMIGMQVGGVRTKAIPPEDAYGDRAVGGVIPPNSTLLYEIRLASLVAAAIVTQSTANLASNAATMTIAGLNFDASTPGANTVVFSGAASPAVGVVTTATSTLLTVTFSTPPTNLGALNAVVTSNGAPSGTATQVATVVAPVYAYVADYQGADQGSDVSVCQVSGSTGALSSCAPTGSGFGDPYGIAVSGGYAYVANFGTNSVSVCQVSGSTGALSSCAPTGSGFGKPIGIAVSGGYAYVANYGTNSVSVCQVSGSTGALSSCAPTGPGFGDPYGIAVSGGYAYVTNALGGFVSVCQVSGSTGALSSCATTDPGAFVLPRGIAVSGGYAYVANSNTTDVGYVVSVCLVSGSTGALSSCAPTGSGFGDSPGIAVSGGYAYVTNPLNGDVSVCQVSGSTGALSSCAPTGLGFAPYGIAVS